MAASDITTAYRHLLRAGLRAVQFSKPARFVVRDQLRAAFREKVAPGATAFDVHSVRRTVSFLRAAARERGLEHRILRNLMRVALQRQRAVRRPFKHVLLKGQSKKHR